MVGKIPSDPMSLVPSSRANPPAPLHKQATYSMSVQRRESNNTGRWREIAAWTVVTAEDDMAGPLNCGLRPNYRIVITKDPGNASPPDADHPHIFNP